MTKMSTQHTGRARFECPSARGFECPASLFSGGRSSIVGPFFSFLTTERPGTQAVRHGTALLCFPQEATLQSGLIRPQPCVCSRHIIAIASRAAWNGDGFLSLLWIRPVGKERFEFARAMARRGATERRATARRACKDARTLPRGKGNRTCG
jgi:hypothetical protein